MKEYFVDFSGFCVIKAENEEKAKETFWKIVTEDKEPLPKGFYEFQGVEKVDKA